MAKKKNNKDLSTFSSNQYTRKAKKFGLQNRWNQYGISGKSCQKYTADTDFFFLKKYKVSFAINFQYLIWNKRLPYKKVSIKQIIYCTKKNSFVFPIEQCLYCEINIWKPIYTVVIIVSVSLSLEHLLIVILYCAILNVQIN